MRKNFIFTMTGIILILILVLCSCTQSATSTTSAPGGSTAPAKTTATATQAAVKPIELALNLRTGPAQDRWKYATQPWIAELESRCQGRLKITPYFSGALSSPSEVFESVVSGKADLCEGVCPIEAGRFPLHDYYIASSTMQLESQNRSSLLMEMEKLCPELQAEFKGIKLLYVFSSLAGDVSALGFRDKPVLKLEEAKGVKIQMQTVWGIEKLKKLGFAPVSITMDDVYMSAQNKVIDGAWTCWNLQSARKWAEVIKHVVIFPMNETIFYWGMNLNKYNALPDDIRKNLDDMSGEFGAKFMDEKLAVANANCKTWSMKEQGNQVYTLPAEEQAKWLSAVGPVEESFITTMASKGLAGKKVMDTYHDLLKKYSK